MADDDWEDFGFSEDDGWDDDAERIREGLEPEPEDWEEPDDE